MNTRPWIFLVVLAGGATFDAHAAGFPVSHAYSDGQLDRIRGGFDLGGDLRASFALQRTVLVNGVQALQTTISVPDIANITADQASALQGALKTAIVTTGQGGVSSASFVPASAAANASSGASSPGLIVQNALDNQAISATTTIDASVNTAHMLDNMRTAESIKDAVIQFRGN